MTDIIKFQVGQSYGELFEKSSDGTKYTVVRRTEKTVRLEFAAYNGSVLKTFSRRIKLMKQDGVTFEVVGNFHTGLADISAAMDSTVFEKLKSNTVSHVEYSDNEYLVTFYDGTKKVMTSNDLMYETQSGGHWLSMVNPVESQRLKDEWINHNAEMALKFKPSFSLKTP
jgi:hypothetical protein